MMEHSKLPWESHFYTYQEKPSHFWIQTKEVGGCSYVVAEVKCNKKPNLDNANAEFIVKACNEYDSLRAKADLLDEAIEALDGLLNDDLYSSRHFTNGLGVLDKAKELK